MLRSGLVLAALGGVVWAGLGIGRELADLVPLASGPQPYFIPAHALFLQVWVPFVALAASALFLAPGLLLMLALARPADRFEHWLIKGFTLSLFGVPVLAAAVQAALGLPMTGAAYVLMLLAACLPGLALGGLGGVPPLLKGRGWDVALMILLPVAFLVAFGPKFYWDSLNDDGAHALLNTMLFIGRGLPFWPAGATETAGYPSTTMMSEVFLQTGIVRFFGATEASVRIAFLPGLAILAGVMLSFLRDPGGKTRPEAAIGLGAALFLFSFAMAFNTSYGPYIADIALPLAREPLIVLGFLGYVLFFLERRPVAMAAVSTLGLLSAPNGLLLVGFFLGSHFLLTRPWPFRDVIVGGLIALAVSAGASAAMAALQAAGLTRVSGEFGAGEILRRLRFVTPFETQRLLFWLLPAGILPGLALLAWRWQDRLSRVLTLTTVIYVLFFYVQAYRILPHHFAPAALVPLIVFWRLAPVRAAPGPALVAALAGVGLGAWASWPDTIRPFTHTRDFAARIAFPAAGSDPLDLRKMAVTTGLLSAAFPPRWTDREIAEGYGMERLATYAHMHLAPPAPGGADYRIAPQGAARAPAEVVIAGPDAAGFVLIARDADVYDADRLITGLPATIADLYRVPRESIFGHGARGGAKPVWDLARIAGLR
ncbi:hypothetical protein [Albidovulum sp.]|uniref:hypothetical protein n=1 Tax=Albidovulum sp. TaxID=1872424 RepID=UPI0039B8A42E